MRKWLMAVLVIGVLIPAADGAQAEDTASAEKDAPFRPQSFTDTVTGVIAGNRLVFENRRETGRLWGLQFDGHQLADLIGETLECYVVGTTAGWVNGLGFRGTDALLCDYAPFGYLENSKLLEDLRSREGVTIICGEVGGSFGDCDIPNIGQTCRGPC